MVISKASELDQKHYRVLVGRGSGALGVCVGVWQGIATGVREGLWTSGCTRGTANPFFCLVSSYQ